MAFLRLIRLPNVFTVIADIMMGFLLVHPSLRPLPQFVALLLSSICLYWAGMVLNDVFDVEQDRKERPGRPIPSGDVSLNFARVLGFGLLLAGVACGWLAGYVGGGAELPWRSGVVAAIIAACVVGYDGVFKKTVLGPLLMGGCRMGNILLGMSTGAVIHDYATVLLRYDAAQLAVAGGIGIYVAGVTWFARHEADEVTTNKTAGLATGIVVMCIGLCWLAAMTLVSVTKAGRYDITIPHRLWPILVSLLAFSVIRRAVTATLNPTPPRIQLAVKQCILSLIVFDAAVCLATRTPWWWSVIILSLTAPMLLLSRWFYST